MLPFHWQNCYADVHPLKGLRTPSVGPSSDTEPPCLKKYLSASAIVLPLRRKPSGGPSWRATCSQSRPLHSSRSSMICSPSCSPCWPTQRLPCSLLEAPGVRWSADDRQAPRSHAGSDYRSLCAPGERICEGVRFSGRRQHWYAHHAGPAISVMPSIKSKEILISHLSNRHNVES